MNHPAIGDTPIYGNRPYHFWSLTVITHHETSIYIYYIYIYITHIYIYLIFMEWFYSITNGLWTHYILWWFNGAMSIFHHSPINMSFMETIHIESPYFCRCYAAKPFPHGGPLWPARHHQAAQRAAAAPEGLRAGRCRALRTGPEGLGAQLGGSLISRIDLGKFRWRNRLGKYGSEDQITDLTGKTQGKNMEKNIVHGANLGKQRWTNMAKGGKHHFPTDTWGIRASRNWQ